MTPVFLYGTLLDPEHLRIVAGSEVEPRPATLYNHGVFHAGDEHYPRITEVDGKIDGLLIDAAGSGALVRERFDFYEGGYGYGIRTVTVETDEGPTAAEVFWPGEDVPAPGRDWSLAEWQRSWGAVTRNAAREAMLYFGKISAEELVRRMPALMHRAQARLLAEEEAAQAALEAPPAGSVELKSFDAPYAGFITLAEYELSYPTFDGARSNQLHRAAVLSADAVVLLPYDPARDRVHLIEQFRVGAFARGDTAPYLLEAIAGRVDAGETPEEAARREAMEEGGLNIGALHLASRNYPSPGVMAEYMHIFIGLTDLPDDVARFGGLDTEDEDIRAHVVDFDRFEALLDAGAFRVGPLALAAHWLVRHRDRLRQTL